MASKTGRSYIALSLVLCQLVIAVFFPRPAAAEALKKTNSLPDFDTFVQSIRDGDSKTLRGVYTTGLFAFPVIQQPAHDPSFVSTLPDTLTQFGMAQQYGNTGLLAHDFLAGSYFSQLSAGQEVQLVYGDGRTEYFTVTQIYRYQATDPTSVYSSFIDLNSGQKLSSTELFRKMYTGSSHVTFQTCIEANGNSSWGRLFVIAEPQASTP